MSPPKSNVKRKRDPDKTVNNLTSPAKEISPETAADLRGSGYNPRSISPEKLAMLNAAMVEFGDLGGVVFNSTTGRLISGHQRRKNLDPTWLIKKEPHTDTTGTTALGYVETPYGRFAYREVAWSEEKEIAGNVAANNHGGENDDELLSQLLKTLSDGGYDMSLTGFNDEELKALMTSFKEDGLGKEDPEVLPVENPFVQRGDLWVLGNGDHRLYCGDSTSIPDIDKLMMGEKADMVVTDPPYGVFYENSAGKKIENDDLNPVALEAFLSLAFAVMAHALKPGGAFWIYHADGGLLGAAFRNALKNTKGLMMKQVLIWVKNTATLCRSDFNMAHESMLYGWSEGAAHYYDGDFTRQSVVDDEIDTSKMDKKALQTLVADMRNRTQSTVIRIDKPTNSEWHPTQKPVRLFERNVYSNSRPGEICLDLFSGSGTLIITCRKTGRRARGMEYDPKYLQASLIRYREYSGEEPMLMAADGKLTPYTEVEKKRKNKSK
jgi:DNA modification methylase